MKIFFISMLALFYHSLVFAQQLQQRDVNTIDFDSINIDKYQFRGEEWHVDELPIFKGKNADFNRYITKHVVYPTEAYNRFIEGAVFVSYVIDTNGKIKEVTIVQSANTLLNAAAIDVVVHSPKWKPARYKGSSVSFKKIVKITFSLQ